MKNFLILLLIVLFTGCAHTRTPPASNTAWLDAFEPSGSFCLDGFAVNSARAGCSRWSSRVLPTGVMEMRCTVAPDRESIWTSSTFIFYTNPSSPPPLRHQPVCSDMNGILGVLVGDPEE